MVALSDFDREFSGPPLCGRDNQGDPSQAADWGIARIGLRLGGAGLIAAAFGLWTLPSDAADPAMMLIKLMFSLALFGAGMLGLHAARRPERHPEVQIDRRARVSRVLARGLGGSHDVVLHRFDDLQELSLRDGLLSARDRSGHLVTALDVSTGRGERALRKGLAGAL